MSETATVTPMMQQYHLLRRDLPPDTLLLFRLGDFYELFLEDALQAAPILNVALTKRGETPMCGVPYHAARGYLEKLLAAGKRVALCEQVGEVQTGKLVRREITRILSPGTLDDVGLEERQNNFTATIVAHQQKSTDVISFGLAYADLSTGEFFVTELATREALLDEIMRLAPAEILAPKSLELLMVDIKKELPQIEFLENYLFELIGTSEVLRAHFKVQSLDGFGGEEMEVGIMAAGGLLYYITRHLRRNASHLQQLRPYRYHDYLLIDAVTQSHLELVTSSAGRSMTLLAALDRTKTPMGARMLRDWIMRPLIDVNAIEARQEVLACFLNQPFLFGELSEKLSGMRDVERSLSRLSQNSGNARDLAALNISLLRIPQLKESLKKLIKSTSQENALLQGLLEKIENFQELTAILTSALVEEPPAVTKEGGMIREGFDAALDELRSASKEGKNWVASLQEREITRTGIKSLKVRFNAVFGYFIEVTSANLAHVPADYVRKQTTANGERFVTPELKEMEQKILGAEERSKVLEQELFQQLRREVLQKMVAIQTTATAVGTLDTLCSLAETARLYGYVCPGVDDSTVLLIKEGRHPVLDQQLREKTFVPNDTDLEAHAHRMGIITGPNMAGKSTYLKQVALLTIMAQMGSYLPVASAHVGIVDRLFTRVGANDDLSRGQSTFMVEMNETSRILHHATSRSLVLLDEIGRGTATFDGLSLAWSVAEYLHDEIKARTLFATHYHELPDLARTRAGVRNLNVVVREQSDEIIFLHKIVPGAADRSYGIQVARLAGLPHVVIERAKEILKNLEKAELNTEGRPQLASQGMRRGSRRRLVDQGPTLFDE
ncbi:MAG: DNA mismatch repair protein MutS [Chthoniobacterales bacterium]|nr:DNA mismatch repair protein MutS [Chthoniobacterales bacterium]